MAKIRHIAITTTDPVKLGEYYIDAFGLTKTGMSNEGAVWLTDGYMDIALLPGRLAGKNGVNHWGFTLDGESERDQIQKKMAKYGLEMKKPDVDRPYVELKATDPDGNRFDIALGSGVEKSAEAGQVKLKNNVNA